MVTKISGNQLDRNRIKGTGQHTQLNKMERIYGQLNDDIEENELEQNLARIRITVE